MIPTFSPVLLLFLQHYSKLIALLLMFPLDDKQLQNITHGPLFQKTLPLFRNIFPLSRHISNLKRDSVTSSIFPSSYSISPIPRFALTFIHSTFITLLRLAGFMVSTMSIFFLTFLMLFPYFSQKMSKLCYSLVFAEFLISLITKSLIVPKFSKWIEINLRPMP